MLNYSTPLIYVVDDDCDEHCLLQNVFTNHHTDCTLRCLSDGAELLIRLTHRLDGRLPDLILLDLHMPVLSGYEILRLLKSDPDLCDIPVVIRTLSEADNDVKRCYDLGSKAYIIKGRNYQQLAESVNTLRYQWLN